MAARSPAGRAIPSIEQIQSNPVIGRKGEKILTVLALDLSSSCVGWAVGANGKVARYGKLVFKSTAGPGEKLVSFADFLTVLVTQFWPEVIVIEKPLSRRASTTARHFELLGIVRHLWFTVTGMEIPEAWLISPMTIKSVMGVKRGANHSQNKQIMVAKVNSLYGLRLKYSPTSKLTTEDDIADAIAVLTTYYRKYGTA
jgi:Holliday junction resolvasome RuvABC endonuclease subunit